MQTEFFVSKGDQQLGPWSIDEIATRLSTGELVGTDFLYDDEVGDWVAILESHVMKQRLREGKPKAPPSRVKAPTAAPNAATPSIDEALVEQTFASQTRREARAESKNPAPLPEIPDASSPSVMSSPLAGGEEWFIQKGPHRYGPFNYAGIVKGLQEKTVYEFDILWKNGMTEWMRLAEIEDFQPEKIRRFMETSLAESRRNVFLRRQFPRVPFDCEVIVHDNQSVWIGRAFEGSAGGSGVTIENATLVPGQMLLLHFSCKDGLPAFNALCEIVSKKFSKEIQDAKSPVGYGFRFVKMDPQTETKVHEYFLRGAERPSTAATQRHAA